MQYVCAVPTEHELVHIQNVPTWQSRFREINDGVLNLSKLQLEDKDIEDIIKVIAARRDIQSVDFSNNDFGDYSAMLLAEALRGDLKHITNVDLSSNHIGYGAKSFQGVMREGLNLILGDQTY